MQWASLLPFLLVVLCASSALCDVTSRQSIRSRLRLQRACATFIPTNTDAPTVVAKPDDGSLQPKEIPPEVFGKTSDPGNVYVFRTGLHCGPDLEQYGLDGTLKVSTKASQLNQFPQHQQIAPPPQQ